MNILAFDTSSSVLSVALKTGKSKIDEARLTGFFQHAENLLPLIAKLLKKHKTSLEKIDLFLLGRGPGSFTGLRVGFATLKGFMAGHSKRCEGALSLDMLVEPVDLPEKSWLGVCLDAGRQRLFFRVYRKTRLGWQPKGKIQMLSVEETAHKLPANAYITGDALRRYQTALLEAAPLKKFIPLEETLWYPSAAALIRLALEKPESLKPLKSAADLIPRYFRLSEPEERRKHASLSC